MGKTTVKVNTKEFARNLAKFFDTVEKKNQQAVSNTADEIANTQYAILLANVKQWTGNLANSITINLKKNSAEIGPDFIKAPYAGWIEDGRGKISSFLGYHYMRDSIRKSQMTFIQRIKASFDEGSTL